MKTVMLALLSVVLLVTAASAQEKDDLKSMRETSTPAFYRGLITGMTMAYVASYLATCPRPVNGAMVQAVLDAVPHRYDDRASSVAVLNALTYLGCEVDTDYIVRHWSEKEAK